MHDLTGNERARNYRTEEEGNPWKEKYNSEWYG
jgi:hypothetical protein